MELERTFSPTPEGARAARHFVQAVLGDLDPDVCHVTMLLTSELATNAIVHARTDFVVTVSRRGNALRVAVRDDDPSLSELREPKLDGESGRGLVTVDALADAWGIEPEAHGKVVWFRLSANGS